MSASTAKYQGLITSEYQNSPNFISMINTSCQPCADSISLYSEMNTLYDLNTAVGEQLDAVGQWIGVSRNLQTPITNIYFALDTVNLGFDKGIWQGKYDPSTGLTQLPDDYYRVVLYSKILNNQWNGTLQSAYALAEPIFAPLGYTLYIEDHGNLFVSLGLIGAQLPSSLTVAILTAGFMDIKPLGVAIQAYFTQSVVGPIFGFDIENSILSGFDVGGWAIITP